MEKVYFKNIRAIIIDELKNAQSSIKVAVAWFTNHDLFNLLCQKLQVGVTVELIVINDFINNRYGGLDFQKFIRLGGKFYFANVERPMHNKFCIIDNQTLISGSYNWTYFAESINHENVIIIKDKHQIIEDFKTEFEYIKSTLNLVEIVTPLSVEMLSYHDLFSAKQYLSKDIYQYAISEEKKGNDKLALNLVNKSLEFDAKNSQLISASESIAKKIRQRELEEENRVKVEKIRQDEQIQKQKDESERIKIRKIEEEKQAILAKQQQERIQNLAILENVKKLCKKGKLEKKQKLYDESIASYKMAIELKNDYAKAYHGLSGTYWRKKEYANLKAAANKALDLGLEKKQNAYNMLAFAYAEGESNHLKAIEYYDMAIALEPDCYVYYWNKGIAEGALDNENQRIACFKKTIELCTIDIENESIAQNKKIGIYAIRADAKGIVLDTNAARSDYEKAKELYDNAAEEDKDLHDLDRINNGLS